MNPNLLKRTAQITGLLTSLGMSAQSVQKPNVVLIVADDLGYMDLQCYGSSFYETPNLDRLANESVRFTNAYAACPVSSPSRAALYTGKYPIKTGITDWIPGRGVQEVKPQDRFLPVVNKNELALEEVTIAELLRNNGYKTMFAGKWHLGGSAAFWPENQGWDVNKGGWEAGHPNKSKDLQECGGYFSPYCNPRLTDGAPGEYLPERLVRECMHFMDTTARNAPFFITLPFYLVHTPLQAKAEKIAKYRAKRESMGKDTLGEFLYNEPWMSAASGGAKPYRTRIKQCNPVYAAMVEALDENIGTIINYLKANGLYENTLLIFTSDNGGLSTAEGSPTSNLPLRGGKGWLYEGGIREPLIIKFPGTTQKMRTDVPASGIDLYPTIAKAVGIATSDLPSVDGVDLHAQLFSAKSVERALYWHYPHYSNQGGSPGSAIRLGRYKLINDMETGTWQLYDLVADVSESKDVSAQNPELTAKLKKMLEKWRTKNHVAMPSENPNWNKSDVASKGLF